MGVAVTAGYVRFTDTGGLEIIGGIEEKIGRHRHSRANG